jgi:hypothetical protein
MSKRMTKTELWMRDHPSDTPCPSMPDAAHAWRCARGLETSPRAELDRMRYAAAMEETRAWRATLAERAATTTNE